jgi:hypothetical protein
VSTVLVKLSLGTHVSLVQVAAGLGTVLQQCVSVWRVVCVHNPPGGGGAQVQVAAGCGHSLAALLSVYTLFCVCDVRMCLWTISTDVVGEIVTSGR